MLTAVPSTRRSRACAHLLSVCWTHTLTWSTCTAGATEHAHLCFLLAWFPASVQEGLIAATELGQECELSESDLSMVCGTLDTQLDVHWAQVSDSVCVCVCTYVAVMDASSIDLCKVCSLTACSVSVCVSVGLLKQAVLSS